MEIFEAKVEIPLPLTGEMAVKDRISVSDLGDSCLYVFAGDEITKEALCIRLEKDQVSELIKQMQTWVKRSYENKEKFSLKA